MKNTLRVFGVLLLLAVYCLAIGPGTGSSYNPAHSEIAGNEQARYHSGDTVNHFHHISPAGTVLARTTAQGFSGIKFSFGPDFSAVLHTAYDSVRTFFSQYRLFPAHFVTLYRKADQLFPFHYFW